MLFTNDSNIMLLAIASTAPNCEVPVDPAYPLCAQKVEVRTQQQPKSWIRRSCLLYLNHLFGSFCRPIGSQTPVIPFMVWMVPLALY